MRRRERKRLKEEEALLGSNVCRLCKEEANEKLFGKFFVEKQSGFSVHQYCMFFSSGLAQRGEDDEGFDGFLIEDIKKEISRSKRLRCSFCKMHGASIGCCESRCHQAFHYKCGRERGSLFQFFDSFNSYCLYHRPMQNVILEKSKNQTCPICRCEIEWDSCRSLADVPLMVPCCKRSWFHNSCLQRHAQSSGLYYFRCPMCNNMDKFQEEMKRMGIFIPEQDATSSTQQSPVGDHSMDPYTSDEDQSSSSTEDCEVNDCTVSDDNVPLATLRRNQEESVQLQSSVEADVREGASPTRKRPRLSSIQGTVVEAEADSSAADVKVLSDPIVSEEKLVNFENKQEPSDSDDDSCLITKVVKKPCPLGNDKFGKCYLKCCNPVGYFCPDVIATSSKGYSCKC